MKSEQDLHTTNNQNNFFYKLYNGFVKYLLPDYSKLKPTNPMEKYLLYAKSSQQFKKLPAIYTNPKYNPVTKRLEFGSFDYELEQAKKKTPNEILYSNNTI